jgi:hypothetical protein
MAKGDRDAFRKNAELEIKRLQVMLPGSSVKERAKLERQIKVNEAWLAGQSSEDDDED